MKAARALSLSAIVLCALFLALSLFTSAQAQQTAPNVTVTLNGPSTLTPGETGRYSITASINDITILSFPAALYLTTPDEIELPIKLEEPALGGYEANVYVTSEGTYMLEAVVSIADVEAVATKTITVRKPDFPLQTSFTREGDALVGTATLGAPGELVIEAAPLSTGPLASKLYALVCTVPCEETCTISCPLPASDSEPLLVRASTRQAFVYEQFSVLGTQSSIEGVVVEPTSGVGEPVALRVPGDAQVYALADGAVSLVPLVNGELTLLAQEPQQLHVIVRAGDAVATYPVAIVERTNVVSPSFEIASDGTDSWWYAYVSVEEESLVRLPSPPTVRTAHALRDGRSEVLAWYKNYVVIPQGSGFIEVQRGVPSSTLRDQQDTAFGVLVRGSGLQRYSFSGRVSAYDETLEPLATYFTDDVSVVYARDSAVSVVNNAGGALSVTQPLRPNDEGVIRYDVRGAPADDAAQNDSIASSEASFLVAGTDGRTLLRQLFAGLQGERSLLFTLPPGSYLAFAQGDVTASEAIRVLAADGSIAFDAAKNVTTLENQTVVLTHLITNGNVATAVNVQVRVNASAPTLVPILDVSDSDDDGVADVLIGPGQTVPITTRVFIPSGTSSARITLHAASEQHTASVTDTITVRAAGIPISLDARVTSIAGTADAPIAIVYNSFDKPLAARIETSGESGGTQLSATLEPGSNSINVPSAGAWITVRVTAAGDAIPENDWRTKRFAQLPGDYTITVSERFGIDHELYTVQTGTKPGYVLAWLDANGVEQRAQAMPAGANTIWSLGRVPANTEFTATFIPGTAQQNDVRVVIDNTNARVKTKGTWVSGTTIPGYVGFDYLIDLNLNKGSSVEYAPQVARGQYAVSVKTPADPSLAQNVRVTINGVKDRSTVNVNQRQGGEQYIGLYELDSASTLSLSNAGTSNLVVADSVILVPITQIATLRQATPDISVLQNVTRNDTNSTVTANGTLVVSAIPNQRLAIDISTYVTGVVTVEAPSGVRASATNGTLLVQTARKGAHTITLSNGSVELAVVVTVAKRLLYDSSGSDVAATITLTPLGKEPVRNVAKSILATTSGTADITLDFGPTAPLSRLVIHEANPSDVGLGIERVPKERAQQFTERSVVDAFAINPEFDTPYTITRIARGIELLKCTEYDFLSQTCTGGFVSLGPIVPGKPYSRTLTPEDPIIIEVNDLRIAPRSASCQVNSGSYSSANCNGVYDDTPTCANELLYCDETAPSANRESLGFDKNNFASINASYGNVSYPLTRCDTILSVVVDREQWSDTTATYSLFVDADSNGFTAAVATGTTSATEVDTITTVNVTTSLTGGETWDCEDFFGASPTARIHARMTRTTGPAASYNARWDYLVYRIAFNYSQSPLEALFPSIDQGAEQTITGADIWGAAATIYVNVTKNGVVIEQQNATADGAGAWNLSFNVTDYALLGSYTVNAYQIGTPSINATTTYTVTQRVPTITTQRVGDYFRRGATVIFSGTSWAKNAVINVTNIDPLLFNVTGFPTSNTSRADGTFTLYWPVSSDLATLTGRYNFTFTEEANTSYTKQKNVTIVILPSRAFEDTGENELANINVSDGVYATFTADVPSAEYINVSFPTVMATTSTLTNATLWVQHRESGSNNLFVRWWNLTNNQWVTICTIAPQASITYSSCDLTKAVNISDYMNRIDIRLSDNNLYKNPESPLYEFDIAFLEAESLHAPPNATALAPPNNTWSAVQNINLTYNVTTELYGILQCRVYVNGALVLTNNSITVNVSSTVNYTFAEGNNTWYASCTDNSSRQLIGNTPVNNIIVDLTNPTSTITYPATNGTWFASSTPSVLFTPTDNLDAVLNYTAWINGTAAVSATTSNGTSRNVTFPGQADGFKTAIIEVWDEVFRYATNKTVTFYVDTTPPTVSLVNPIEGYFTSNSTINFTFNFVDALSPTATCNLWVNNTLNASRSVTNNTLANFTVYGFGDGARNWTVECQDLAGNRINSSETRNFTVDSVGPTVNLVTPLNNTYYAYRNLSFVFNASDFTPLTSCSLFVDGAYNQSMNAPARNTNVQFNVSNFNNGNYTWQVRCNDTPNNTGVSLIRNVVVGVIVVAQSPDGIDLDRDGMDATDIDVTNLVANLSDNRSGATVYFYANLTDPAGIIPSQTNLFLGANVTNGLGVAQLRFDPNSTLYAGNYTWWAQEASSISNNSALVYVYGGANLSFTSATLNPSSEYGTGTLVTAVFSVSNNGPENHTALASDYTMQIAVNFTQPNGTVRAVTDASSNGSTWNTSYALPGDAEIGNWNVSAVINSSWFYPLANTTRNFTVKGYANALSPPNSTRIDRDSVDATDPDVVALIVQIRGATQQYRVNFTANLTSPSIGGQSNILLGNNTTNATGHAVLYWNPNSTTYAGLYTWWGASIISFVNQTGTVIVMGGLNTSYEAATHPNASYNLTATATSAVNVTSRGPESVTQLNASYGIAVQNTYTNTSGATSSVGLVFNGSQWRNTTFSLLPLRSVGVWNTSANASGTYFYENRTNRTITVYGFMNASTNSVTPSTIYAYDAFTSRCQALDEQTAYEVSGATMSFYRNGTLLGTNTTNATGYATLTHTINATGVWTITCNVADQPSILYFAGNEPERNTSITVLPYLITPTSPANGTRVDRDGADGTDPDVITLTASVPGAVPDGVMIDFRANISAPSIGGQTNLLLGNNTTVGGVATVYYNPGAARYAGTYNWFANASAGTTNGSRTHIVLGSIRITFRNATFEPNAAYNQTDIALVRTNITSNGPETRTELSTQYALYVQSNVTNTTGSANVLTQSYTNPYWNSSHDLSVLQGVGAWSARINASSEYFYVNATNRTLTVYGYMNVTSNATSPTSIFSYQSTATTCTVLDELSSYPVNGVNVTFYRNGTYLGLNATNAAGSATLAYQINETGVWTITCNVTSQPSAYYFRGSEPERNSSVTVVPFPIRATSPANGTAIDRDETNATLTDVLAFNLSVPSYVPDGVMLSVLANLTAPSGFAQTGLLLGNNTTSGGSTLIYWNAASSVYAGNWTWYGNNSDGRANETKNVLVYGTLQLSYASAGANPSANYTQNETIEQRYNLTSYGPETRTNISIAYSAQVTSNVTNTTSSTDSKAASYTNPYWNASHTLLDLKGVGVWSTSANASAEYFLWNATNRTFTVYGYMNVTSNTHASDPVYAYEFAQTTCSVQDQHTQYAVNGATVNFYRNGSLVGTNTTNAAGSATLFYQTNTTGTYTITCNVTNQLGIYYYAGDGNERNSSLQVVPFPVTPTSPANGSIVDRDSVSAANPDELTLTATVPSIVPDGVTIDFRANITTPAGLGLTNVLLGSNTTLSGVATYVWNPANTFYAGNWTLFGNSSASTINGTRNFVVKGALTLAYRNATYRPNSSYNQTDNAIVRVNITSQGPETRNELNTQYAINAENTITNTSGQTITSSLSYTSPFWNATHVLSALYGVGTWNTTANASSTYFYENNTARNFTLYGFMNVTSNATTPTSIYAYQSTATTCGVQDQLSSYAVAGAIVSFYRNGTLLGTNTTNPAGNAQYAFQINNTGTWTITCNVTDQPGIYYYRGNEPERNTTVTVLPYQINASAIANGTRLDRDEVNVSMVDVVALNLTVPAYVPDGIMLDVRGNLTAPSGFGQTAVFFGNNTTTAGSTLVYFNPGAGIYAGNWTWYGNGTDGAPNEVRNVLVYGQLRITYENNSFDPDANYTENESIVFHANVTSSGPETRDQLSAAYAPIVRANASGTYGTVNATLAYSTPVWVGSTPFLSTGGVGNWNTSIQGQANWFFTNNTTSVRNTTVFGYMNVTDVSLLSTPTTAYSAFRTTCTVLNQFTDRTVAGAAVSFYYNGTLMGVNTTNASGIATLVHVLNATGVYSVSCAVSDQLSIYYYAGDEPSKATNLTVIPFRIQAISPANDTVVDRDSYDAVDPDVVLLNVSVPSTVVDGANIQFLANLTTPSGFAQTNVVLGNNTTSGGFAVLWFNPSAALYAGNWSWFGNASAGEPNNTRTLIVKGALITVFTSSTHPNASYNQTDSATVRVNLTSAGPESRVNLSVAYGAVVASNITNTTGSTSNATLSFTNPYWNSSHALSALYGVGTWRADANASASFFYSNATNRSFTLYGFMNVTSNVTTPTSVFTYQSTATTCTVNDQLSSYAVNGATVQFYRNGTLIGSNTTDASGSATLAYQVNVSGTWTITCNVTNQPGIYYFRGSEPERNSTLTVIPYPIRSFSVANGTGVDRDETNATLADTLALNLTVPSYVPDGTMLTVLANLTAPAGFAQTNVVLGNNTTTAGSTIVYFNPASSVYAGNWTWYGNNSDGRANETKNFLVYGTLQLRYNSAATNPNANYTQNETIEQRYNLTSYGPETRTNISATYSAQVTSNVTNTTSSTDSKAASYTNPYWNASHTLLDLKGVGVWSSSANASAEYFLWNATNRTFTVYGYMNVTSNTHASDPVYAYEFAQTTCSVQDQHTQYAVNGATVNFYRNGTLVGTNTTNTAGSATLFYQTNTTGTYTITCNVTNQLGIYYYAGDGNERNSTLQVLPVPITPTSPANGSIVDRDSVSAANPDELTLTATVPSIVPDGVTIDFRANITTPAGLGLTNVLLGSNTTLSGVVTYVWNPANTFYAGNWTLFANNSASTINGTRNFVVKGALTLTYRNATYRPNSSYNQTDNAIVRVNITSQGPETRNELNTQYAINAQNTITNTSGHTITSSLSYTSPFWNATHALSALYGVGTWNTTANASSTYFYENNTARNFTLYGFMNVTSNATSPTNIYAYQSTATTCGVQDQLSSYAVAGATVSFYRNGTLLGTNTTNPAGNAQYAFQINSTGTWTITCNVTDQPGIYYYRGNEPERSSTVSVLPFPIGLQSPVNDSIVDRDSYSAVDPDVLEVNATVPSYVPDGVMITVLANLTSPSLGASYIVVGNNTTAGGIATVYWNPGTSVYAGNHTLWANGTAGLYNETRTALVYGVLIAQYRNNTYRPNATYNQSDTAFVFANVTSLGPETRDEINSSYGISVESVIRNTTGAGLSAFMSYSNPYWNASHYLGSLGGVGNWSSTVNASGTFWYSNATNRTFEVFGVMNVTANVLSPSSIFAYQSTLATCTVLDQFSSYAVSGAIVSFYRNGTLLGTNTTDGAGDAQLSFAVNVTGSYTITCNVTDQPSIFYWQGDEPEMNSTLTVNAFPIMAVSPANGTAVDRDAMNATLADSVLLNVSVPSYVPDGVMVDFRANLTLPNIVPTQVAYLFANNTTSGGNVVYWFNPNASVYAGNWSWYGNSSAGAPNNTLTLLVFGQLNTTFANVSFEPDANYTQNESALILVNLTSLGVENRSALDADYAASVNITFVAPSGANTTINASFTNPRWNGTFAFLTLGGVGVWNITAHSSGDYFLANATAQRNTTVYGYANVTDVTIISSPIEAFSYVNYECTVLDMHTDAAVANMNVSYWKDATLIGSNVTNASGVANLWNFEDTIGVFNITCSIEDDLSIYYYAGDEFNRTEIVNVTPISLTPEAPANGTIVDRDSVSADPDAITLVGRVRSTVPDNITVYFWANLTDPVSLAQFNVPLGSNVTNGTYINFTFNPNSTMYAGNWTWWMNNSGGLPNGTRHFLVYGGVNLTYENATYEPNSAYNESDVATLRFNMTSYGPESIAVLNGTYNVTVVSTLVPPAGGTVTPTMTFNGSTWNTSQVLFTYGPGVWNTSAAPSGRFFYPTNFTLRNFTVFGFMNVYAFDSEERWNGSIYANTFGHYFVNVTNSTNGTLFGAACTFAFYDRNMTTGYNATSEYYENATGFSLEGVVTYTVTCTKQFYNTNSSSGNATLHSAVNVSVAWNVTELAAGERMVIVNVTNLQNYTEHDVYPFAFVPRGLTPTYEQTPIATGTATGPLWGTSAQWYMPNITAFGTSVINFTVSGTENITDLFTVGVQVYSTNTSIVY